jgi:dihydroxyacetone kinase
MPGDLVDVIAVPAEGNAANDTDALDAPPTLAADAEVYDVKGNATEGGGVLVTLVVDKSAAARIAAYSTAGRVAIVETPPTGEGTP